MKPSDIQEAANMVALDLQLQSINDGWGPVETLASKNIELPLNFPNDWRACDFTSLVNLDVEVDDE